MNGLRTCNMIISKIIEVCMWIATVCLVIGIIATPFVVNTLNASIKNGDISIEKAHDELMKAGIDIEPETLEKYAHETEWFKDDGTIRMSIIILTLCSALALCAGFALIFRTVFLIFKTSAGKTKYSQGETPFQPAITRMIRNISIVLFAVTAVIILLSWFGSKIDWSLSYVIAGLMMLSLSYIFEYGEKLQNENNTLKAAAETPSGQIENSDSTAE